MIQSLTNPTKAAIRAALERALRDDSAIVPLDELIWMLEQPYLRDLAERAIVQGCHLTNISSFGDLNREVRHKLYDRMIGGRAFYILAVLEFIGRTRDPYARRWVMTLSKSRGLAKLSPEVSQAAKACASVLDY